MLYEGDPKPTRAIYDLLVQCLSTSGDTPDSFELHEDLRDVYKMLSTQDPELIAGLSRLQYEGMISSEGKLYLFVLFTVARTIGPYNLTEIRSAFVSRNCDFVEIRRKLDGIMMDARLKVFLQDMVEQVSAVQKTT